MRLQPSKYKYIKVIAITGATITVEVWVLNLSSYQLLNTTFGTGTGWLPGQRLKAYGFVELFSGEAWTSRCMRNAGINTASFDIKYGQCDRNPLKQDCMDLCTDAGFAFLWLMTLDVSAHWLCIAHTMDNGSIGPFALNPCWFPTPFKPWSNFGLSSLKSWESILLNWALSLSLFFEACPSYNSEL